MVMRETDQLALGVATHVLFDPDTAELTIPVGGTPAVTDGLPAFPTNQDTINRNGSLIQDNDYEIYIGRLEYEFNNYSLTSITGYIDRERTEMGEGEQSSVDFARAFAVDLFDSFSSELRFSTIGDRRIDWTVGALYAEDTVGIDLNIITGNEAVIFFATRAGCPPNAALNDPACLAPVPPGFLVFNDQFVSDTTSWAVFADATWHVNGKLDLTVGGRYTDDEVEKQQTVVNFEAFRDLGTDKESFDDFSPRFVATYAWTDDLNFYGLISKGYKAGGLQLELLSGQIFPLVFDEEELWNYEVGMKGLFFDNRLRLAWSVFYMDWTDIQVTNRQQFTDPASGNFVVFDVTNNAEGATSAGVEFEFDGRLTDSLRFNGSIGYLDTEFDDFVDSGVEDLAGNIVDLTGSEMTLSPEWTFNLNGEYRRPITGNSEGFFRAEFVYQDEMKPLIFGRIDALARNDPFVDGSSGSPFEAPSYDVWNFRAGIENDRYRLVAWIENAFDELYWTGTWESVSFSGIQILPNPRTFGVRLTVRTK